MIIIKLVKINDVPYYSLNDWSLYGTPIVEQSFYDSSNDDRGFHIHGKTNNTILQPMIKKLYIMRENEQELREFLYELYYQDMNHKSFDNLVDKLKRFKEIIDISINPNKADKKMIEIVWR